LKKEVKLDSKSIKKIGKEEPKPVKYASKVKAVIEPRETRRSRENADPIPEPVKQSKIIKKNLKE
jgi:hypothetical protein